ncbi:MAG: hypothetical protein AAFX05_05415, partial [Planctomycetota bacterium]
MMGLIVRRLVQLPLILLVIYTVTFMLAWALPGSAVLNDEGRAPPKAVLDAMEEQYNLVVEDGAAWQRPREHEGDRVDHQQD